jgi:DNA-binding PucR family transcriptional regulator
VALRELVRHAEEAEHLARGPVVDLLASTAKGDVALVETVRAYLDTGGDVTRAAADLGVHRNTVRYRVGRFESVTGVDLADPAQRLVAQVQLLLSR